MTTMARGEGRGVRRADRQGFALPIVLIIIFVLAGGLAAGFTMTRAERAIDDSGRSDMFAQTAAETGLNRAMVDRAGIGLQPGAPPAYDSARVTLSRGYADVIVTQLRPAVGSEPALYLTRSHGVSTVSKVANTPAAEFTVTMLSTWLKGTMQVRSAFTSITGIAKNGNSGLISGVDSCGAKPNLPAVSVPQNPGYQQSGGNPNNVLQGGPPLADSSGGATSTQMAASVPIDWNGIINGGIITPDFTSDWQGNGFPSSAWFTSHPTAFPTILVNNDTTLAHSFLIPYAGQGLLIVKGDLTVSGSDMWKGVTLVGGIIISNGNNTISGAVVTGLNVKFGWPVPEVALGNGTKDFFYNSCNVDAAVAGMGHMRPYKSTWNNVWASY